MGKKKDKNMIILIVAVIGILAYAGNFGGFRAEISPVTYEKLLTGQWDNAYATQEFTCHADACSVTVGVELQRATANWGSNKWWKAPTIITPAGTVTGPCVTSYSSSGDIFLLRDRKLTANKTVEITKGQKITFTTGASCGGGGYDDQISPTGIWSLKFEEWYKKCDGTWEIVNIYTNQPYVQTSSDSTASWSCPSTYGKCSVSCQGDANIYNGWVASQEQSISRVFTSKTSCTSLESTYGLNTHKLFDDKYYNIQRAQGPQYSGKVFCPSDVDFCRAKVYDQSGVELTSSGNDNIQKGTEWIWSSSVLAKAYLYGITNSKKLYNQCIEAPIYNCPDNYQYTTKGYKCTPTVLPPPAAVCGDGVIQAGETSDTCCQDVGCTSGKTCENNVCVACTVGQKICAGNDVQVCKADKTGFEYLETCSVSCTGGNCNLLCTPNSLRCTGSALEQCAPDGLSWGFQKTCDYGCINNACTPLCTAGSVRCDINKDLEKCSSDGLSWSPYLNCQNGCTNNVCLTCTPGTSRCNVNTRETCATDGSKWTTAETCQYGCDASVGKCSTLCISGQTACEGQILKKCRSDGFGWDIVESCSLECISP